MRPPFPQPEELLVNAFIGGHPVLLNVLTCACGSLVSDDLEFTSIFSTFGTVTGFNLGSLTLGFLFWTNSVAGLHFLPLLPPPPPTAPPEPLIPDFFSRLGFFMEITSATSFNVSPNKSPTPQPSPERWCCLVFPSGFFPRFFFNGDCELPPTLSRLSASCTIGTAVALVESSSSSRRASSTSIAPSPTSPSSSIIKSFSSGESDNSSSSVILTDYLCIQLITFTCFILFIAKFLKSEIFNLKFLKRIAFPPPHLSPPAPHNI